MIDLTGVQPVDDGMGAGDRPGGAVDGGEEAVAGGLHFASSISLELLAHDPVVHVEGLSPPTVVGENDTANSLSTAAASCLSRRLKAHPGVDCLEPLAGDTLRRT